MELKEALENAEAALKVLDGVIAETVQDFEKELKRRLDEQAQAYKESEAVAVVAFETELQRELDAKDAEHEHALDKLNQKLILQEEAVEFYDDVYAFERKGVLDTASPVKRLVFEKLAARWDSLTNAELDDLEALLDGKLTFI